MRFPLKCSIEWSFLGDILGPSLNGFPRNIYLFCNGLFCECRGGSPSYSPRRYQHAPAHPPPMVVAPRRSVFRDAAAVAGGVTVGTTMVWSLIVR